MPKAHMDEVDRRQQSAFEAFAGRFAVLDDPRKEKGKRYTLAELMFMALSAVLSGADSWVAAERFCQAQKEYLRQYIRLPYGVPSDTTFERVFALVCPQQLFVCLTGLLQAIPRVKGKRRHIAMDGKSLCASMDKALEQSPLHLLHAFGTDTGLLLGQQKTDGKENEITAFPRLLEQLDIQGHTLTMDALLTQKEHARLITERGGDYIMALKENHPSVHKSVVQRFAFAERMDFTKTRMGEPFGHRRHRSIDSEHGRIEERIVDMLDARGAWFHHTHPGWPSVQSVARVTSHRTIGAQTSTQVRYFLCSHPLGHEHLVASCIRGHWMVENNLHWCLDMLFDEDRSRIRKGHGPENFAVLRRVVLGLLKGHKGDKLSLKMRRQTAAWNPEYRSKLLGF